MGLGGAGHVYVSTAGVSVGARAGTALCDHLLPTWDSVWPQGDEADHWTFRLGPLYVRWGMRAIKSGGGGGGQVWQGSVPTDTAGLASQTGD